MTAGADPTITRATFDDPSEQCWCLVIGGRETVRRQELPLQGSVHLGRSDKADVRLTDVSISRDHAVFRVSEELWVEDLKSTNGTKLRGTRLTPGTPARLQSGDVLQFGAVTCHIERGIRREMVVGSGQDIVIGASAAMTDLYRRIDRIAQGPINVLIMGETGSGKDVVARGIHARSPRASGPFLALNCSEFAESLAESELFGHEKGAFTGAAGSKTGMIERADGGTLFLDELGEMPLTLQAKLLRVLEDRAVRRVGGGTTRPVDIRIVSATNRNLEAQAQRGDFRQDLLFRLAGISLRVPPLRERRDEIEPLARLFLRARAPAYGLPQVPELQRDAILALTDHEWPGNVRELKNVIERALLLGDGSVITAADLALDVGLQTFPESSSTQQLQVHVAAERMKTLAPSLPPDTVDEETAERQRLMDVLARHGGNQRQAAAEIGISRFALMRRLEQHGIVRPRKRPAREP